MSNNDGTSALAIIEKPALMLPVIPSESEIRSLAMIADYAARSNFLRSTAPKTDQAQRQADAFFIIMYGRELGIPPMTALKTMYVLDGQPSAAVQTIIALARRQGVEIDMPDPVTVTDSATIRIKRPGGAWKSYTFTMTMAAKMGLAGKQNWQKQPALMLIWRAAGIGLRFEASDYTNGLYPLEELAPDTVVNEDGEPVGQIVISKPEPEQIAAPAPQPAPAPEQVNHRWHMETGALLELAKRSHAAGFIGHDGDTGIDDMLALIAPKLWADFPNRNEAALAVKAGFEALKQMVQDAPADPVKQAAAQISTQQAAASLAHKPGRIDTKEKPAEYGSQWGGKSPFETEALANSEVNSALKDLDDVPF